ncbi:hypothetical protein ACGFNQ_02285 [Streptomyces asoensis]|uniref:hypothetical protein n=1 Tax=Streptomyces asoensis TaxID=249586 RepID=UPI003715D295
MKICDRCGKPIMRGEGYDTIVPDSMSGARPNTYVHQWDCMRPRAVFLPRVR